MPDEFIEGDIARKIALIQDEMSKEGITPEQVLRVLKRVKDVAPELTGLKWLGELWPLGQAEPGQASCFLSFSAKDKDFTTHLFSRLRDEDINVYYSFEHIRGGQKVYEQLKREIEKRRRLLLVLSENSMQSQWVITEIRLAREIEIRDGQQKLFPIRIVNYDAVKKWECFDSDSGIDLAVELRKYHIPDFSNWKDQASFDAAFKGLLRDLRME